MRNYIVVLLLFSLPVSSSEDSNSEVGKMEHRVSSTLKLLLDSYFLVGKEALKKVESKNAQSEKNDSKESNSNLKRK